MRKSLLPLIVGFAAVPPAIGQLALTSLSQNGQLTWTNSVSNVTYRVEWTGSPTGAWQRFDALTNLNSIAGTSTAVTVLVPLSNAPALYRVVWSDAPFFAGLYDLREWDRDDNLVATGRLWLAHQPGSDPPVGVDGALELHLARVPTNSFPPSSLYGPQFGTNNVAGTFDTSQNVSIGLPLYVWDNNVNFSGTVVGNAYLGKWYWYGVASTPLARIFHSLFA